MLCQPTQDSMINAKAEEGKKIVKNQRLWMIPRRQCFPDTTGQWHVWSQRLWQLAQDRHKFLPIRISEGRRGAGEEVTPIVRDYQPLLSAAWEKACFLQWTVVRMYINHISGWPHAKKKLVITSWTPQLVTTCCFHIEKETEREIKKKRLVG